MSAPVAQLPLRGLPTVVKRSLWIVAALAVLALIVTGTRVVPDDDPRAQRSVAFDPAAFGAENFAAVRQGITDAAVDASDLALAITADPAAAAEKYATESSGGPVYSVKLTGTFGEGQSGVYDIAVEGIPSDQRVRVQTGPAINGTELRDATGEIQFGQFTNQIDYQDAASALNEEMKKSVLAGIDAAALTGKTVTVTGAFTLINPAVWLVTPVELEIR